jgi:transcriptional regulator with PAS, ATPase and Fis domain
MNHKTEQDFIWDTLDEIFPNTTSDIYPDLEQKCTLDTELREKESYMIRDALNLCDYNQTHTASALGIGRTNLIARCKRLGISLKNPDLDGTPTFQI